MLSLILEWLRQAFFASARGAGYKAGRDLEEAVKEELE
jgi:hypothetical protein